MAKNSSAMFQTGDFRGSFVKVLEPEADGKRSIQMLFKKTSDDWKKDPVLEPFRNAIREVMKAEFGDDVPKGLHMPIIDGDEKPWEGCEGMWLIRASTKRPVGVVDGFAKLIMDPSQVYSGAWYRAMVHIYPFEYREEGRLMKRGFSVGLDALQKIRDGEPLGGTGIDAESVFSPVAGATKPASKTDDSIFDL